MNVHFKIEGEYITELARKKLHQEKDIASAVELLDSCTKTDELSDDERMLLILKILNGDAEIQGVYPDDNYHVQDLNDNQVKSDNDVFRVAKSLLDQCQQREEQYNELQSKYMSLLDRFDFVVQHLSYSDRQELHQEYKEECSESWLFEDVLDDQEKELLSKNSQLNSFLAYQTADEETNGDDYGWLEPDGTFHPVAWSYHTSFIREYLEAHYPFEKNKDLYWSEDHKMLLDYNDVAIDKLGWILIHSPSRCRPFHHVSSKKRMTKKQKEFLYDFYKERHMDEEADELYKNE